MWEAVSRLRWMRLLRGVDARSRLHLRAFCGQVAFIVLLCTPTLFIDQHRPLLFLWFTHILFAATALILVGVAVVTRQSVSHTSLCMWDHVYAMLILMLISSIALRIVAA